MAAGPIEQFEVHKIVDLPDITVPGLGVIDLAITNSTLAMTFAFLLVVGFMAIITARPQVVPGRVQMAGEMIFGMIDDLASNLIGPEGRRYFPFVFTLFTVHPGHEPPGPVPGLHRHLAAGGDRDAGADDHCARSGRGLRQERPRLLQAVRAVGRADLCAAAGGADRVRLLPAAPLHPGPAAVRQHAGRPRGAEGVRRLRDRAWAAWRPAAAWASSAFRARRCR